MIVVLREMNNGSAISWRRDVQWHDDVGFVLDQDAEKDCIVLAHWNNSSRVDMSLHSLHDITSEQTRSYSLILRE